MLRTFPRLREVSVGVFNARILIAVAKLLREGEIAVVLMLFFRGALGAVRIIRRNLGHIAPTRIYAPGRFVTPSFFNRSRACSASLDFG